MYGIQISEEFDRYERAEEYAIFLSTMTEFLNKNLNIEIVYSMPTIRNEKVLTAKEGSCNYENRKPIDNF